MPLSTEDVVRETHRLALEEHVKRQLKTQDEWDRYLSITATAAERMDVETDAFRDDYQDRLLKAEQEVMREQSGRFLDHPSPSWVEDAVMSDDRIEILAHNRVLADHETRKRLIRVDQVDAYEALREDCRTRAEQEKSRQAGHYRDSAAERTGHVRDAFATTQETSPHEAQTRAPTQGRSGPSRP